MTDSILTAAQVAAISKSLNIAWAHSDSLAGITYGEGRALVASLTAAREALEQLDAVLNFREPLAEGEHLVKYVTNCRALNAAYAAARAALGEENADG